MARRQDDQTILGVFNVDPAQAADSLNKLAALDAQIACFGHGEPVTQNAAAELRAAADRAGPVAGYGKPTED